MVELRTGPWTVAELDAVLDQLSYDEWTRYEIIGGELYVSRAPGDRHQAASTRCAVALSNWNYRTHLGVVLAGPGLQFGPADAVIPDVVWMSRERLAQIEREDRLYGAAELVVEVLSPGGANERRDREIKLRLYSEQGVDEYWILDWRAQTIDTYRRVEGRLQFAATLRSTDTLTSPLLPGFAVSVGDLFIWP